MVAVGVQAADVGNLAYACRLCACRVRAAELVDLEAWPWILLDRVNDRFSL